MSKIFVDKKGNKINIKPGLKRDTKIYGFYKLVKLDENIYVKTSKDEKKKAK